MVELDPYRSGPPSPRRALAVLRGEGLRVGVLKALDASVYARLRLFARPVATAPAPPASFCGGWVEPDALAPLESARPGIVELARHRAARGDRCFAMIADGAVVSVRWSSRGIARLEHLGLDVALPPTWAYSYDLWTDPASRRQGQGSAGNDALCAALAAEGVTETMRAIVPENGPAITMALATPGIREVGTAYRLGLGPLSRRFVRWRAGAIGSGPAPDR